MISSLPGHARWIRHGASSGLLTSLRRVGASLAAIVHSRAELISLELARERVRVARLLLLGILACFFLALGAVTATIFVIVLFWDSQRLVVIGFLTVLYVGIGVGAALYARREAAESKRPFAATIEELRRDRDHLRTP